jgi:hypothetical protein
MNTIQSEQILFLDPNSMVYKVASSVVLGITVINVLLVIFFLFTFISGKLFQTNRRSSEKLPKHCHETLIKRKGIFSCHNKVKETDSCSICLTDFSNLKEVIEMPKCMHSYHAKCILEWFNEHNNCPYCRADITESLKAEN